MRKNCYWKQIGRNNVYNPCTRVAHCPQTETLLLSSNFKNNTFHWISDIFYFHISYLVMKKQNCQLLPMPFRNRNIFEPVGIRLSMLKCISHNSSSVLISTQSQMPQSVLLLVQDLLLSIILSILPHQMFLTYLLPYKNSATSLPVKCCGGSWGCERQNKWNLQILRQILSYITSKWWGIK